MALPFSEPVSEQRFRGCDGGLIQKHRSMITSLHQPRRFFLAALTAAFILIVWSLSLDAVATFWASVMNFWQTRLGIEGQVSIIHYGMGDYIRFSVPYLYFHAGIPSNDLWWGGTILTALLILASVLLPHRFLPVSFMLRIVAFFQGCAQVFFVTWPYEFPYRGGGYVHGTMIACLMLISLVPVLLGFTYFLFDFKLYRKIGLALLTMCHLIVMVPLQYVLHAYLLSHLSLLFLPLLFFVFGLPLNTLVLIAFYSWGFSWKDHLREDDRPQATPAAQVASEGATQ
ncbi:MAG: hypothetical protein KOO60_11335 [Gemmatimonadales bacterium]|nr:hypothetical protein [Gemmatimonadales bacterium]